MAIENKVTELYQPTSPVTTETIQAHIDEQNEAGYYLVAVDYIWGWYRFFWAKEVE